MNRFSFFIAVAISIYPIDSWFDLKSCDLSIKRSFLPFLRLTQHRKLKMSDYNNDFMEELNNAVGKGKGKHALREKRQRVNKYEPKIQVDPFDAALLETKRYFWVHFVSVCEMISFFPFLRFVISL
jgi:hypothetical protein